MANRILFCLLFVVFHHRVVSSTKIVPTYYNYTNIDNYCFNKGQEVCSLSAIQDNMTLPEYQLPFTNKKQYVWSSTVCKQNNKTKTVYYWTATYLARKDKCVAASSKMIVPVCCKFTDSVISTVYNSITNDIIFTFFSGRRSVYPGTQFGIRLGNSGVFPLVLPFGTFYINIQLPVFGGD